MVQVRLSIHISLLWLCWMVIIQALVGSHDILILGKSPIEWRQGPDMTLAVDWDVKHQFRQTKPTLICLCTMLYSVNKEYNFLIILQYQRHIKACNVLIYQDFEIPKKCEIFRYNSQTHQRYFPDIVMIR